MDKLQFHRHAETRRFHNQQLCPGGATIVTRPTVRSTDAAGTVPPPVNGVRSADLDRMSAIFEGARAEEIMQWAVDQYAPDIALSCSFGGPSGMVLVDMAVHLDVVDSLDVFYLDTGLLFEQSYVLVSEVERRYGIRVSAFRPDQTVEEQAEQYGDKLWERNPDLCCSLRKVEPNFAALEGKKCWITGVRRDQSRGRSRTSIVAWKPGFGIVKVNPLALWSNGQVWEYIRTHKVPYNPLHDQGYPSLGCTVCTQKVEPDSLDPRSGRWSGSAKTECGLHMNG